MFASATALHGAMTSSSVPTVCTLRFVPPCISACAEALNYRASLLACRRCPTRRHRTRAAMYIGRQVKAGLVPVSDDEMYLFFLKTRATPEHIEPKLWPQLCRRLWRNSPVRSPRSVTPSPHELIVDPEGRRAARGEGKDTLRAVGTRYLGPAADQGVVDGHEPVRPRRRRRSFPSSTSRSRSGC